jgi:hypothetical protein
VAAKATRAGTSVPSARIARAAGSVAPAVAQASQSSSAVA